ncbi:MAG: carbonic anhydrase [Magnetococcus sp. YQC-5]
MNKTATDISSRFLVGFCGFRERYFSQKPELFETLVSDGQRPKAMVVSCSDSRVDPAILFGAEPGEIFVIRNVANLIPPYEPDGRHHGTSAALEFAVRDLGVRNILVLGHSRCGGMHALQEHLSGQPLDREFIASWVSIAASSLEANPWMGESHRLEQAAIRQSLANLRTFPWVKYQETAGDLTVHGWWFEMDAGRLWYLDESRDEFQLLDLGGSLS